LNGAKRKRVGNIVLYPLPQNMGKSLYKHDFNKFDKKLMKNLKSETMNREIEANRMFSSVRKKNKYNQDFMTTQKASQLDIYGDPRAQSECSNYEYPLGRSKSAAYQSQTPDIKI